MTRMPVESSHMAEVGYIALSGVLEIQFKDGAVYQYEGVEEIVYAGLMQARSKGKYFAEHIKKSYPCRRIDR